MLFTKLICVACIAQSVWFGVPVSAGSADRIIARAPTAAGLVDQGVRGYLEGRYEQAREMLVKALSSKTLDDNRRMGALYYLACCNIALDDLPAAKRVFAKLLKLRADYQLPTGTAPKIVRVFEQVKAKLAARTSPRINKHPQPGEIKPLNPAIEPPVSAPPEKKPPEKDHGSTWWIWVLVGGVVAGVAVGLGVGLSAGGSDRGRAIVNIQVIE
jgi:hypothetical protein